MLELKNNYFSTIREYILAMGNECPIAIFPLLNSTDQFFSNIENGEDENLFDDFEISIMDRNMFDDAVWKASHLGSNEKEDAETEQKIFRDLYDWRMYTPILYNREKFSRINIKQLGAYKGGLKIYADGILIEAVNRFKDLEKSKQEKIEKKFVEAYDNVFMTSGGSLTKLVVWLPLNRVANTDSTEITICNRLTLIVT